MFQNKKLDKVGSRQFFQITEVSFFSNTFLRSVFESVCSFVSLLDIIVVHVQWSTRKFEEIERDDFQIYTATPYCLF